MTVENFLVDRTLSKFHFRGKDPHLFLGNICLCAVGIQPQNPVLQGIGQVHLLPFQGLSVVSDCDGFHRMLPVEIAGEQIAQPV